jgi:hypothetical protein
MKNGKVDGACFAMGIKLGVKGGIPQRPVGQMLKIALGEVLQTMFLLSHFFSLQATNESDMSKGERSKAKVAMEERYSSKVNPSPDTDRIAQM